MAEAHRRRRALTPEQLARLAEPGRLATIAHRRGLPGSSFGPTASSSRRRSAVGARAAGGLQVAAALPRDRLGQ
eukprot:4200476-Pyramimonas_sp.AAC.1